MKKRWLCVLAALLLAGTACRGPHPAESAPPSHPSAASATAGFVTTEAAASESGTTASQNSGSRPSATASRSTGTRTGQTSAGTQSTPARKEVTNMKAQPVLQGLPGTQSKELLQNPDRGFRLELTLNPATGKTIQWNKDSIEELREQLTYYGDESPRLAQNYIYLTDYSDRDLDQQAFDAMQRYFDALKEQGIRSLLRFAYEFDESNNVVGPTTAQMLRHMQQLKPFLEKNKDGIHVIQAGFIGLWGEWHHSVHPHDQKVVLEAMLDMTPKGKLVQVRTAANKNVLAADDPRRARVSYHDLYLVGVDHVWSSAIPSNTTEYQMMLNDSANMLMDGEMPWGSDKQFNNGVIDGLAMAQRLQKFHFSTLSVVHNYKEGSMYANYNMNQWKSIAVDESYLKQNGLRYAPSWLKDADGKPTQRSLFAYIRDYLGYYLEASGASVEVSGKTVKVSLNLQNYGFSAPHGMQKLELVLTDANNKVIAAQSTCAMSALQPGKTVGVSAKLSASALYAGYKVGVRFVNERGTPARLANALAYENGINILTVLE